jgi:membrane-associated phospholipid phosphatase
VSVSKRTGMILAAWVIGFIVAVAIDWPVASWVDRVKPIPPRHRSTFIHVLKSAGDFHYVAIAIVLASLVHRARWRAGVVLLISCALSGLLYGTKWIFGRHRPSYLLEPFTLHPFMDGLRGIFYAQKLAFPSGHACLVFAAASCLAVLFPRGTLAFYAIAIAVGVERVLEGAHYPSDVLAGAAIGVFSTWAALRLASGWFGPTWHLSSDKSRATGEPSDLAMPDS